MSNLTTSELNSDEDFQCLEDLNTWKNDVINNEVYALTSKCVFSFYVLVGKHLLN